MIILSWNCRGSAGTSTVQELVDLCRRVKPAVLFLMETRAKKNKLEELRQRLKFEECFCVEAEGLAGGLGLFWSKEISIQVAEANQNFIHASCCEKDGGSFWDGTFIYGNPNFQERRHLWVERLQLDPGSPRMCIGDFNQVICQEEKVGLRPCSQGQIELFKEFLYNTGLMDFDIKGCKFTWFSNPRDGFITRERIDRCIATWEWRSLFPNAVVTAVPAITFDHCPLILDCKPKVGDGGRFKYEAFWEDHEQCADVIRRGWGKTFSDQDSWLNLLEKTRLCKRELSEWNNVTFKNAAREIGKLKKRLSDLLNRAEEDIDWAQVQSTREEIKLLWSQEEKFWGQRSRLKWL